jgi:hypothetical protein
MDTNRRSKVTGWPRVQYYLKEWGGAALEILKWVFVLWLLFPLARFTSGGIQFTRVLLGILLFIIFSGKTFYDTIIMGMIRGKRVSLKKDIVLLLGMALGAALIVGIVVLMVGLLIIESGQEMNEMMKPQ